jgi:uncharacterized membrane protein
MNISDDNKIRLNLLVVGTGLGLVIGWITNVLWYAFSGIILGWGDSAPDWYFNIRNTVQTTITVVAVLLTLVGLQLFFNRCRKRKKVINL